MTIAHMTSSDYPGYCHMNRYINNIEGLQVFMSASIQYPEGGTDGNYTTEIGIGIAPHLDGYYDAYPAWITTSVNGCFIDGPRFNNRRPFLGGWSDHPWVGSELTSDTPYVMNCWLSVSQAHVDGPYIGYCDLTMRMTINGEDHTETMLGHFLPVNHGLIMISGGFFGSAETTVFRIDQLIITEQP